jgi:hypothetical protein
MKNWKTTVGGILLGVGTPLAAAGEGIYKTIGVALATVGGLIVGITAKDSNVTGGTVKQ